MEDRGYHGHKTEDHSRWYLGAVFLGSITVVAGVVILGWLLKIRLLVQIHNNWAPMQFNTALCFLLSGWSLWAASRRMLYWSFALVSLVIVIGGLTLMEYWWQTNLGIDQWLVKPFIATQTAHPGRMAPTTALCFFLGGMTLILVNLKRWLLLASFFSVVVTGLGMIALVGYLFGLDATYGWGHLTKMALHTSIGFVMYGICLASWALKSMPMLKHFQNHILVALSVVTLVVVILQWQSLRGWEGEQVQSDLIGQLDAFSKNFQGKVTFNIHGLARAARTFSQDVGLTGDSVDAFWVDFLEHFPEVLVVQGVDELGQVKWTVAGENGSLLEKSPCSKSSSGSVPFEKSRQEGRTAIHLMQPNLGCSLLQISVPAATNLGPIRYIVGILKIDAAFIDRTTTPYFQHNFYYRIVADGELLAGRSEPFSPFEKLNFASKSVPVGGESFQVELIPTHGHRTDFRSPLQSMVLFSGVLGLGVLLYLFRLRLQDKERELQYEHEIKQRIQTQSVLDASRRDMKLILDSTKDGILVVGADNAITFANPAACRATGHDAETLIGMPYEAIQSPDSMQERLLEPSKFPEENQWSAQYTFRKKDGSTFPVDLTQSRIRNHDGVPCGAVIIFQDISDRRNQERSLARYTRELERSNKDLNDFAYVASHDLKGPLRGIMQLSQWIKEEIEDDLDEQTSEYFHLLQSRVRRMEKLLDDLLHYSRAGHMEKSFKAVDLNILLTEIFKMLQPKPGLELVIPEELPKIITLAVPLELVLRNLLQNAIKHHDREEGVISVGVKKMTSSFEFRVADDGPGIPEPYRERVFKLFQTLKPRDEVDGSGMGLAIVKKILSQYNGSIRIESAEPRGAVIVFNWPFEAELRSEIYDQP